MVSRSCGKSVWKILNKPIFSPFSVFMATVVQGPFPSRPCPGDTVCPLFLKMALLAGGRAYRLEDVMKLFSNNVGWEGIGMSFV